MMKQVSAHGNLFVFGEKDSEALNNNLNGSNTSIKIKSVMELFHPVDVNEELYIAPTIPDPANHIVAILCSSRATGRSKGVCLFYSILIAFLADMMPWPRAADLVITGFSSLY